MLLLLRNQQRPVLQNDERDIDGVDGRQHRERDDPPRACWRLLEMVRLNVCQDLAAMILEELQQAPHVRPTVCLFRALDGHASDEVGLRTQEDREGPGKLDPLIAGKLLGCRLDDQVDLMQCTPNAEHWVFGTSDHASDKTGVATCIVFSSSDDMPINLARHLSYNASKNLINMLKIFPIVWRSNMGIATRCRLRSRPRKQMRTHRSKNDWPRCVLPLLANDIAETNSSSRQSTICYNVELTRTWTYSPTIKSVMPANLAVFCAFLGVLDGIRRLPKRHAAPDVVHY